MGADMIVELIFLGILCILEKAIINNVLKKIDGNQQKRGILRGKEIFLNGGLVSVLYQN